MRRITFILCICLISGLLFSLGTIAEQPEEEKEYTEQGVRLYRQDIDTTLNRVFYEIFVGSFSDSDGDGIGDLRGIINRLDYLNDGDTGSGKSLGVEGIWLSPVFLSPSYHKYDVQDYYQIDPSFGTMEDLSELIIKCHQRGVIVILDLPINHTSSKCRWYQNFANAHLMHNSQNINYDYYTWISSGDPIPAGRHFVRIANTDDMVECNFADNMPELNFDSERVQDEVLSVAKYYLELGIDGFRFDAAKYVYYQDHTASSAFWEWFIGELRKIRPDIYTVAEVWDSDSVTERYYSSVNCFNFTLSQSEGLIASTAKGGNTNRLTAYMEYYLSKIRSLRTDAIPCLFIANHDTDRAAGYLTVASGRMNMAANLYLLSPGSPFIYYGEELGMRGSRGSANTDANRRLAMVWGDGDTVKDPVGTTYDPKKQIIDTAAVQIQDPESLYSYYKHLILIRKANPEIACGDYRPMPFTDTSIGGFICTKDGISVAVIHNMTRNQEQITLSDITDLPFELVSGVAGMNFAKLENGVLTLGAQTSVVLRCAE